MIVACNFSMSQIYSISPGTYKLNFMFSDSNWNWISTVYLPHFLEYSLINKNNTRLNFTCYAIIPILLIFMLQRMFGNTYAIKLLVLRPGAVHKLGFCIDTDQSYTTFPDACQVLEPFVIKRKQNLLVSLYRLFW